MSIVLQFKFDEDNKIREYFIRYVNLKKRQPSAADSYLVQAVPMQLRPQIKDMYFTYIRNMDEQR